MKNNVEKEKITQKVFWEVELNPQPFPWQRNLTRTSVLNQTQLFIFD